MNHLQIGLTEKSFLEVEEPVLILADRSLAKKAKELFPDAVLFDTNHHRFNPLKGVDARRARDFATTVYAAFPQGENTLTVRNGRRALAQMLLKAPRLDSFPKPKKNDLGEQEASGMVKEILFTPLMRRVLCGEPNFTFDRSVIAILDREELGGFDCFLLGAFLASQHKGHIYVPDFGFYGCPLYKSFIDQDRLTVGLKYLDEISHDLQKAVISIEDKHFYKLTRPDAERLIFYSNNPTGNPTDLMDTIVG